MGKTFCFSVFGRKNKMKLNLLSPRQSVTSDDTAKAGDNNSYFALEDASSLDQTKTANDSLSTSLDEESLIIVNSPPEPTDSHSSHDVIAKHEDAAALDSEHVNTSHMFGEPDLYLSDPGLYSCATSEGSHNDHSAALQDYECSANDMRREMQQEQVQESTEAEDMALSRVKQWVQSIEIPEEPIPEQQLLLADTPSAKSSVHSYTHERSVNHKDLELANNVARALDFHSTVAQLSGIGLTVIPSLGAFSHLRVLKLSANSITRISAGSLPKSLQFLDLSRNKISVIEGLRELTRLRTLILSHNRILKIGKGLANCTSIRELHLAGNKISEVEGLHRLTKLIFLDMSFNKLASTKSLEQIAASYPSLLALDVIGNPVVSTVGEEHLKRFVLSLTPNLVYLNRRPVSKSGAVSRDNAVLLKSLVPSSAALLSSSRYSPSSSAPKVVNGGKKNNHLLQQQQQQQQQRHALKNAGMLRVKSEGALHE